MNFCLVIGEAGIGKTTAVANALQNAVIRGVFKQPMAHIVYDAKNGRYGCQLGTPANSGTAFSGSDGLAYNIAPYVVPFITDSGFDSVICEGDRLANMKIINKLELEGWKVEVVHLYSPNAEFAISRRANRAEITKKTQNEKWAKSRRTKSWNLARNIDTCKWIAVTTSIPENELMKMSAFKQLIETGK